MSRSLYWTLILGCLGLVALYARPAWDALSTTGVPETALAASAIPPVDVHLDRVGIAPTPMLEAQDASSLAIAENH